ncbi:alpha/beta fold hydrolase [Sphingomonas pokkalii]|uniref:Alpha/beta hydrolase n=1 Tax=Sphingomonas pokkalii TaxID=2175090 RepID=A0A2U0SH79_9SPHN|nr:alpha/beta fold hydrolase [Sphingomonas pokkalii]PVX30709.1 alpha/beta hydrolase [Sphingomonas pokkalii]
MTALHRAYADGPFGQIHFQSAAEGVPLVLLHQAVMHSDQFSNVFAPLIAHGLRPIAIDMPGFGMSDATAHVPGIADFAQVVLPVLDALGIDRAVVGGHHTGSLVATETAVRHPDRVRGLVMGGTMVMPDAQRLAMRDSFAEREKKFGPLPGGQHMVELFATRERFAAGTVDLARISEYVTQALVARGPYWYGHHAAFDYDHVAAIRALAVPAMILSNSGDMIHEAAVAAHALRPDIPLVTLPGGGIDIVDQAPQAWADAIADFVATLP